MALFTMVVLAVSCATGPVEIPDYLTAAELIQRGQEASDRNRFNIALQYYHAVLERFHYSLGYVCAAEYEIAFIYYKQKRYEASKAAFHALLERYNSPDAELLPPQFRILSHIVLAKIEEIENRRIRRSR